MRCSQPGVVDLPVYAGVAGAVQRAKLMAMAMAMATRIGVGESTRFPANASWFLRFAAPGGYAPERLVEGSLYTAEEVAVYNRTQLWAGRKPARPLVCRIAQRKTTVRLSSTITRLSLCHFTAWASTCASTSRPTVTSSPGSREWSTRTTSCSMIWPSSRSGVT